MNILPQVGEILQRLQGVKQRPDGSWLAKCPCHPDRHPSLHITINDSRVLLHCFAGCSPESVCSALGITMADLFLKREPTSTVNGAGLTLEKFAAARKLDLALLRSHNVAQTEWFGKPAVAFPYQGPDGTLQAVRYRIAIEGDRFRWERRVRPKEMLYGAWLLPKWREQGVQQLFLVEGESDCLTLWQAGIPAVGVPGADCLTAENASLLSGFEVALWREPDAGGDILLERAAKLFGDRLRVIEPPSGVKDPSELWLQISEREPDRDAARVRFSEQVRQLMERAVPPKTQLTPPAPPPRCAISLRELMTKEFAPLTYLVPDMLPEGGLSLLAGRPKVGKSWFALQVACALSSGGFALGLDTPLPKRKVLYCALEDGLRRLQQRIKLVGTTYDHDALHVTTELSPLDRGGVDELRHLIRETGAQVVFIDVAARILPKRRRNDGVYQHDYDAFAQLKTIAETEDITLVCLHHESKAPNEDPLMRVSGSTGLTGAVDTVLTLSKKRGEQTGTLFVTGRDIEREGEYALSFTAGKWYVEGEAYVVRMSEERRQILQAIEDLGGKATPREVASILRKNYYTTRNLLTRMLEKGEICREGNHYIFTNTMVPVVSVVQRGTPQTTLYYDEPHQTTGTTGTTPNHGYYTEPRQTMGTTQTTGTTQITGSIPSHNCESDVDGKVFTSYPISGGMAAWCDVCCCSMLHVPTRDGEWECVGCMRVGGSRNQAVDIQTHSKQGGNKP